jgi:predicted ATPase
MIIDCGSCAVAGPACSDCVVSVLLGMPEQGVLDATSEAIAVADEHTAALAVLADSGLVPPLRLVKQTRAS